MTSRRALLAVLLTGVATLDQDWDLTAAETPRRLLLDYGPVDEIEIRLKGETVVLRTTDLLRLLKGL